MDERSYGLPDPLSYPFRFPANLIPPIETARDAAESTFIQLECQPGGAKNPGAALDFAKAIFREFGLHLSEDIRKQLCDLEQARHWEDEFLVLLASHAFDVCRMEKTYNRNASWTRDDFTKLLVRTIGKARMGLSEVAPI